MQEPEKNRERLSALVDGQLCGEEFAHTVEWLDRDDDARLTWDAFHLVGEVLRSGEAMVRTRDTGFVRRVSFRLQQEPSHGFNWDAIDSIVIDRVCTGGEGVSVSNDTAANDSTFRWKLLAGVASMALVSVIGWQAVSDWGAQTVEPKFAQGPVQVQVPLQTARSDFIPQQAVVAGEPQVMLRDEQLDALLAAHRQFGGMSALQVPTGFIRNATFEGANR